MDTLIRNLDASTYRAARARAALEGREVGELVTAVLREYLTRTTGADDVGAKALGAKDACRLLDEPLPGQGDTADENHAGTPVDEIVFLYCI